MRTIVAFIGSYQDFFGLFATFSPSFFEPKYLHTPNIHRGFPAYCRTNSPHEHPRKTPANHDAIGLKGISVS
jgi:hypothetical protein